MVDTCKWCFGYFSICYCYLLRWKQTDKPSMYNYNYTTVVVCLFVYKLDIWTRKKVTKILPKKLHCHVKINDLLISMHWRDCWPKFRFINQIRLTKYPWIFIYKKIKSTLLKIWKALCLRNQWETTWHH